MKCFVIMPYAAEFDDVHLAIDSAVRSVREPCAVECLRLDDDQRGGRIVGRLEHELRECDLCVADLSGGRCNVMWEVGYAMALEKPVILVSQGEVDLHFDLHDVQHVKYQRSQLKRTLTEPLSKAVAHTVRHLTAARSTPSGRGHAGSVDALHAEVGELKAMVRGIMTHFAPPPSATPPSISMMEFARLERAKLASDPRELAGVWRNAETGSCIYARFIDGDLVAPYCFGGDHELTGVYHSLQRLGEFLHARYEWIHEPIRGFSLLRLESADRLTGAWWLDEERDLETAGLPPIESGAQSTWIRMKDAPTPRWAADFHRLAETVGVEHAIERMRDAG